MLRVLVLVVPVVPGVPGPRGRPVGVVSRGCGRGPGGGRLAVERERLAHPALEQVDERGADAPRRPPAGSPRRSRAARSGRRRWCAACPGDRPTVSASKGRSGHVAVRASSRSQAIRRAAGPSFEYVTEWTTSPRTPGHRPDQAGRSRQSRRGRRTRRLASRGFWPPRTSSSSGPVISSSTGSANWPGGSSPRAISTARHASGLAPPSRAARTRSAICHCSSASRSIGMASSKSRVRSRSDTLSRSRRKARTGWRRNRSSWSSRCRSSSYSPRGCVEKAEGVLSRVRAPPGPRPGAARRSSTVRPACGRPVRSSVGRRAAGGARTRWRHGPALRRPHGVVDHVEQLTDRHGRRTRQVGALVATRVRHDQVILRRQERVEEQLAVFAADVAVTDSRVPSGQVVAVPLDVAREAAVVESEQAHHPVRDGAHRHERADGQVAGAEVGPRRPALQAIGQDRAHVVTTQGDRADGAVHRRLFDQLVEERRQLRPLPGVALGGRRQGVRDPGQGVRPGIHGARRRTDRRTRRGAGRGTPPCARPGRCRRCRRRPAGSAPSNRRWRSSAMVTPRRMRSRPELPRVGSRCSSSWKELPVRGVEAPPDARVRRPTPRDGTDRRRRSWKRRRTGSRPARSSTSVAVNPRRRQLEHLGQHPMTGLVWRSERSARRISRASAGSSVARRARRTSPESAERSVSMSGHITMMSRGSRVGIVLEQVQDGVAQHLDLAAAAVAGVDADAVVVGREQGPTVAGRRPAPRTGARSARMSSWISWSRVRGARSGGTGSEWSPCSSRAARARAASPAASRPHEASRGFRGALAVGSSLRRTIA